MKFFGLLALFISSTISLSAQRTVGLFTNETTSQNGYTLFSNSKSTFLIDNCGDQVLHWESEYRPGSAVYLLPDGNLLRTNRITGNFVAGGVGGGFEILNENSEILWSYIIADEFQHAHHDIEILPNGNFLVIVWDLITELESIQLGRSDIVEVWSEKILEIEPVGTNEANIVWEWKLRDHLVQDVNEQAMNYGIISEHPEKVDFNYLGDGALADGDWAHFNGISYHEETQQIAITSRHFGEVWVLDHSTTTEEASTGKGGNYNKGGDILYRYGNPFAYQRGLPEDQLLIGPHSPSWTSNQSLMVFNNVYTTENSSIERWTLPLDQNNEYIILDGQPFGPPQVDWRYTADNFSSKIMSSAQELANGNILICEAIDGRFFEITIDKEIVWEYINPVRTNDMIFSQGDNTLQTETFHTTRYLANDPRITALTLDNQGPIEFNPLPSVCTISNMSNLEVQPQGVSLLGNLIEHTITIENRGSQLQAIIFDINGRKIEDLTLKRGVTSSVIQHYSAGIYFLHIGSKQNARTLKFVKR